MLIKTYFSDNIGEFFYAGSSNGSAPPWRKRRWLPFIMGTEFGTLSLCVTEGSSQRFDDV
jgi:hypothetical protein